MNCKAQLHKVKEASKTMLIISKEKINQTLFAFANNVRNASEEIAKANELDLEKKSPFGPKYDRLVLNKERIEDNVMDIEGIVLPSLLRISENKKNINRFYSELDAAVIYSNTSTAFTDGAQLGLGAKIGINTNKLHARGPMALDELTSNKWLITGDGLIQT